MNSSDAAIILLFDLFDQEYRATSGDELNWRVRDRYKRVDHNVVSMILGDIDGKVQAKLRWAGSMNFVFEDEVGIEKLITMSGGNQRILYRFLHDLFGRIGSITDFPVTSKNVNRVISSARDIANRTVDEKNWSLLARRRGGSSQKK